MNKVKTCECSDPGCWVHPTSPRCVSSYTFILYRIDMEDKTGTLMCAACAEDAYASGLFR